MTVTDIGDDQPGRVPVVDRPDFGLPQPTGTIFPAARRI
jgi:hypothetical protein